MVQPLRKCLQLNRMTVLEQYNPRLSYDECNVLLTFCLNFSPDTCRHLQELEQRRTSLPWTLDRQSIPYPRPFPVNILNWTLITVALKLKKEIKQLETGIW